MTPREAHEIIVSRFPSCTLSYTERKLEIFHEKRVWARTYGPLKPIRLEGDLTPDELEAIMIILRLFRSRLIGREFPPDYYPKEVAA
jgi:hypothetical protein